MPTIEAQDFIEDLKKNAVRTTTSSPANTLTTAEFLKFVKDHDLVDPEISSPSDAQITVSAPFESAKIIHPISPDSGIDVKPKDSIVSEISDDLRVWDDVLNSGRTQAINIEDASTSVTDNDAGESTQGRIPRRSIFGIEFARSQGMISEDTAENMLREFTSISSQESEVAAVIPEISDNDLVDDDRLSGLIDSILTSRRESIYTIQPIAATGKTKAKDSEIEMLEGKESKKKQHEQDGQNPDQREKTPNRLESVKARLHVLKDRTLERLEEIAQPVIEEKLDQIKVPGTDFEIITEKVLGKEGVVLDEDALRGLRGLAIRIVQYIKEHGVPPKKSTREMFASVLVAAGMLIPNGLLVKMNDKPDTDKNSVRPPAAAFGFAPSPTTTETTELKVTTENSEIAPEISEIKRNQLLVAKALKDEGILSRNVLAYTLATMKAESNFMPVREGWYLDVRDGLPPGTTGKRLAIENEYQGGNDDYGRGFIQLTHHNNYVWADGRLGLNGDLIRNHDLALDPVIAARILAAFEKDKGVAELAEKGKFVEARRPINGRDKAQTIAHDAEHYLSDPLVDELIKTVIEVTGPHGSVVEWNQKIIDALVIGTGPHGGEYDDLPLELTSPGGSTTPRARWWEGDYWCTYSIIDAYNLAGIKGLTPDNSEGVEKMRETFQSTPSLKYLEYVNADKRAILKQIRPGYAMIMEEKLGSRDHNAHVGMVKKIEIDGNGNGKIISLESNANKKEKTYEVSEWNIKGTVEPVVAFGGFETV
jgi:hypothetical protein